MSLHSNIKFAQLEESLKRKYFQLWETWLSFCHSVVDSVMNYLLQIWLLMHLGFAASTFIPLWVFSDIFKLRLFHPISSALFWSSKRTELSLNLLFETIDCFFPPCTPPPIIDSLYWKPTHHMHCLLSRAQFAQQRICQSEVELATGMSLGGADHYTL